MVNHLAPTLSHATGEPQPDLPETPKTGPASLMTLVQETRDELALLEQGLNRLHGFIGCP